MAACLSTRCPTVILWSDAVGTAPFHSFGHHVAEQRLSMAVGDSSALEPYTEPLHCCMFVLQHLEDCYTRHHGQLAAQHATSCGSLIAGQGAVWRQIKPELGAGMAVETGSLSHDLVDSFGEDYVWVPANCLSRATQRKIMA